MTQKTEVKLLPVRYICSMTLHRQTVNGLPLVFERQNLTPQVTIFMISVQGDPVKFPMVYKKEFGGWIFVDKMTLVEFKEIEKEISLALEEIFPNT